MWVKEIGVFKRRERVVNCRRILLVSDCRRVTVVYRGIKGIINVEREAVGHSKLGVVEGRSREIIKM